MRTARSATVTISDKIRPPKSFGSEAQAGGQKGRRLGGGILRQAQDKFFARLLPFQSRLSKGNAEGDPL